MRNDYGMNFDPAAIARLNDGELVLVDGIQRARNGERITPIEIN